MTDDDSDYEPTKLVKNPSLSLEDVRNDGERCYGRGRSTAAVRGYDAEKLAHAVFDSSGWFAPTSSKPWHDTVVSGDSSSCNIESKSCVYRYPSGPYGRFRIWKQHHDVLVGYAKLLDRDIIFVYFFVVYTVDRGNEREVGKLVAPAQRIDEVIDNWTLRDHPTMGKCFARDISWNQLFDRLGVPQEVFIEQDIVDLTDGPPSDEGAE